MKRYHLFISHSWKRSGNYNDLTHLLDQAPEFLYHNRSIPKKDPVHSGTDAELSEAIRKKMVACGIVLVLTGVSADYSKWIEKEIRIAKSAWKRPKPILAVRYQKNGRVSGSVQTAADKIVDWNTNSIVNAIRELA